MKVSKVVATAFNQRRIYWQDEEHELSFVAASDRKRVRIEAIEIAHKSINEAIDASSNGSPGELRLVDLLLAISTVNKSYVDRVREIPELDAYNAWVLNIGGDSSEKMTNEEHLESHVSAIREFRVEVTLYGSRIDFLPSGLVLDAASKNLEMGRKTSKLDKSEIEQPWELTWS